MRLVDSHCHLDMLKLDDFDGQIDSVLEAAAAQDIEHLLTVSVSLKTFPDVLAISKRYPNVSCSVGIHPHNDDREEVSNEELTKLAALPEVVAVGETGLDYYYGRDAAENQQANFRQHIQVANIVDKPLIIHTRQAKEDTLQIMREEGADKPQGVLHCFTEDWDMAKQGLDLGFYVSISGIVTFKKAENVREVAKQVPLDRLLIETDSPYLAPIPHRGKQNQPAYVRHVAEYIAELRGISLEELAEATTENFYRLFKGAAHAA